MDFGYYVTAYYPDADTKPAVQLYRECMEQVVLAEDVGFTEVSIPEHHFVNYLTIPSPLLMAVDVAARTRAIRIITACLVGPFYEPRRVAGEIAQADAMTDGRIEIGLGRGGFRYEFDRLGIEWDVDKLRTQFSEFVAALDLLLREEDVTFEGEHYRWDEPLTIMPRPATQPRPQFWIAAVGEGGIRWTTSQRHHLLTTSLRSGWEVTESMAQWFLDERAKLPDGPMPQHAELRNLYVSKDRKDLEEKSRLLLENHRRFTNLFETPGDVRGGLVQPVDVDMTPEEAASNTIIGDPDHVIERVRAHAALGLDSLHVNMAFGASHEDISRCIELFASEVMPEFAGSGVVTSAG